MGSHGHMDVSSEEGATEHVGGSSSSSVNDHTVEIPSASGGVSIKSSKECTLSSQIFLFQQVPLRCAQNMQLRGDQLGKVPRNKTTMNLRLLPPGKKIQSAAVGVSTKAKSRANTFSTVKCPDCPRKIKGKAGLFSHIRAKHSVVNTKNSSTLSPALLEEKPLPSTSTLKAMGEVHESHSSTDEEKTLQDEFMEKESDLEVVDNSEAHGEPPAKWTERDGDRIFCKLCGDNKRWEYRTKQHKKKFARHMEIHCGLRPYPCPYCPEAFTSDVRLLAHCTRHTKKNNFDCPRCFKKFKNRARLQAHGKGCKSK